MRQLFWKEWHELRLLPLGAAAAMVLLIFAARVFFKTGGSPFVFGDTFLPLVGCWLLFGLVTGAGLFAPEVGEGGLLFLSSLPVTRRRVWCVKVATGLGIVLLCAAASLVVWAVVCALLFQGAFFSDSLWHQSASAFWSEVGLSLLFTLGGFAVALAVSPFLDRVVSALLTSLLLAVALTIVLGNISQEYTTHFLMLSAQLGAPGQRAVVGHLLDATLCLMLLCALVLPVCVSVSYWTFTRGESLRSPKRFRAGALAGVVSLGVAGLIFLAGYGLQLW